MLTLQAEKRESLGRKAQKIREEKMIPGVVYGPDRDSSPLKIPYLDFEKVYSQVSGSGLINLKVGQEKPAQVLIHDVQYNPLNDRIQHVDFYQIKEGEKVRVEIDLEFIGEAPAVKKLGGSLMTPLSELEIECLPQDLINKLEIDVSSLKTFDDDIRVEDLILPEKIKVLHEPEDIIAQVIPPRKEEELEALEEKPAVSPEEVEKVGEEKGEAEEGESKGAEDKEGGAKPEEKAAK